jgi:hypothetical protein
MTRFINAPLANSKCDIAKWWKLKMEEYPSLYKIAADYLAIPATSVPSERANSIAGLTYQGRESLGDTSFKAEMCSSSWIKLFDYMGIQLCEDFEKAFKDKNYSNEDLQAMAEMDSVIDYFCTTELFE